MVPHFETKYHYVRFRIAPGARKSNLVVDAAHHRFRRGGEFVLLQRHHRLRHYSQLRPAAQAGCLNRRSRQRRPLSRPSSAELRGRPPVVGQLKLLADATLCRVRQSIFAVLIAFGRDVPLAPVAHYALPRSFADSHLT